VTEKWTRKAVEWIGIADKWTREFIEKFIDNSFEWIQKKNLKIISTIVFLVIFGTLAQLGIIPKLIT
jgi:ABC-type proline/glycine betaine transport system permease subunit